MPEIESVRVTGEQRGVMIALSVREEGVEKKLYLRLPEPLARTLMNGLPNALRPGSRFAR